MDRNGSMKTKGLLERLKDGEHVICAEGYVIAFERQGYIKSGPFVPEVVMDYPELVKQMHRDFVRAGSDVVQAFTFYASRKKMAVVGRENELEDANRRALKMAREIADQSGTLMAGDLSMTGDWVPGNPEIAANVRAMFEEQIKWIVEEGADFIVAETFMFFEEALLALNCIKENGKGLPAVITLTPRWPQDGGLVELCDGVEVIDALKRLEAAGADVVGLNCGWGPETMLPIIEQAVNSGIKVPVAALPIVYRTTEEEPTWFQLTDKLTGKSCYPTDVDSHSCNRSDIEKFTERCKQLGIQYMGLCCGNSPHFTRTMAETLGRRPPASCFSPDMSLNVIFGDSNKVTNQTTTKLLLGKLKNSLELTTTKINSK